jgi:hypothetical protein
MGTGATQGRRIGICIWCRQEVQESPDDGAWEGVESGASGCGESIEQGGDGEHEAELRSIVTITAAPAESSAEDEAEAERRYFDGAARSREIDSSAESYYEQWGGDA